MNTQRLNDDPLSLAYELSDKLINNVAAADELGGGHVAERLSSLRNAVWPRDGKALDDHDKAEIFRQALEGIGIEQQTKLYEAYARMGQLYEIAGLTARHRYFQKKEKTGEVPSGVAEFVAKTGSVEEAVGKLSQPAFEITMTMHPTNTHSLESMRAQRELSKALELGDEAAVDKAITRFAATPVLHQKNGKDTNLTVRDETGIVVNYLSNIYEDATMAYGQFDKALSKKYKGSYKPEELKLDMKLGSWGSAGDKDGNQQVTAETTLEAIAMHLHAILKRYKKDIEAIDDPALSGWKEKINEVYIALDKDGGGLLAEASKLRKDSIAVRQGEKDIPARELAERFDRLSQRISAEYRKLDDKQFAADLEGAYKNSKNERTLDLLRKARLFRFRFARIEYRETAEEYQRVAGLLIDGYEDLTPQQKVERLTGILQEPGKANELFQNKVMQIIEEGATHSYNKKSAAPIAYHTMKRMDLARDFPGMVIDNVLAECGRLESKNKTPDDIRAQGTANLLEAQLMQRMMPDEQGRRPKMGIIPLFEEPGTMQNIDGIMRSAYENPAYKQHMEMLAQYRDEPVTQQVQIAHSDNARRSGLLAARAYIYEAHQKMRALNTEMGVKTQFFEGGSISDAYRNGVRAVSASVNAFGLHDFAKFTFQGGDLVNYFTAPSSTVRLFTRNFTHAASRFERDGDGWKLRQRAAESTFDIGPIVRDRRPNPLMERAAIAALKDTLVDYEQHDFKKEAMGMALSVLDYDGETKAGKRGSRGGDRSGRVESAHDQAANQISKRLAHLNGDIKPVAIEGVRTIGFSEAWQHAGIVPSWIGSQNFTKHLLKRIREVKAEVDGRGTDLNILEREFNKYFRSVDEKTESLTPEQLNAMYEKSASFRDAQDRIAFGVAMTNPDSLGWLERKMKMLTVRAADQDEEAKNYAQKGWEYVGHLKDTFRQAAAVSHASLTGREASGAKISEQVAQALPRLSDDIRNKSNYRDFLLFAKVRELDDHQRGVLHNAGDSVMHGRFLAADDPMYGRARYGEQVANGRA